MEPEPIKEGFLHKAHPKDSLFSVTVWQKRYFILWAKGTLEYYTSYTKKAEEYCGTLNLSDCQDMVAPMSIGKRHNVIKLSVLKEDRIKDYWLDCDCPSALNEWVKHLVEASGLSAEDPVNKASTKQRTIPRNIQQRPLPHKPMEEPESPNEEDSYFEGVNYEEIDDVLPSNGNSSMSRKYTRTSLDLQEENLSPPPLPTVNNAVLLKREAIQESPSFARKPPPPLHNKPPPPIPNKPHPYVPPIPRKDVGTMGLSAVGELKKKLEEKKNLSQTQEEEESGDFDENGPTEEYEEIQFSTEVVVGTPNQSLIGREPSGYLEFEKTINNDIEEHMPSPMTTPTIPPRDSRNAKNGTSSYLPPLPPREHSSSESNLHRSQKPHLPRVMSSSPPPTPPPREKSNGSPHLEDAPPPVPRRLPGHSNRQVEPKRIIPYRTTEILPEDKSHTSSKTAETRHSPLTSNAHAPPPKSAPRPKPKPKPKQVDQETAVLPPKPMPSTIATETKSRPPMILPKPKPQGKGQSSTSIAGRYRENEKLTSIDQRRPMPPPKPVKI